jgi:hypothetical protein
MYYLPPTSLSIKSEERKIEVYSTSKRFYTIGEIAEGIG